MERVEGLRTYFDETGYVGAVKKVIEAFNILHERGPQEGSRDALDLLLPKGLHARADVDAYLDLLEKAWRNHPTQKLMADLELLRDDLEVEGLIAQFADPISERVAPVGLEQASEYTSRLFRKLPLAKSKEVQYLVVYDHKDFQVRAYQPYQMARASVTVGKNGVSDVLASSLKGETTAIGDAFKSVVEYVQKQGGAMKVMMPIVTDYNEYEKSPTAMGLSLEVPDDSIVVPDPRITYGKANMQFVAVRKFLGIASDLEVREQYEMLSKALIADGVYEPVKNGAYSLLQYHAPRAMPWRRRNEIGISLKAPKQS